MNLRNIAIIAHVDHGKTTLVDRLLQQSGSFRENQKRQAERAMDSNDLERERGITILAKATSVLWHDTRINIVDTPGHADFGGEVERILNMVDGALVLVDAAEGPLPQTKFVVSKALKMGLKPIVVINKVDRPDARAGRGGQRGVRPVRRARRHRRAARFPDPLRLGQAGLDGDKPRRLAGRRHEAAVRPGAAATSRRRRSRKARSACSAPSSRPTPISAASSPAASPPASVKPNQTVKVLDHDGKLIETGRITKVLAFRGLERVPVDEAEAGDIVAIAGLPNATVAHTICDPAVETPIPAQPIDPPTLAMTFRVNDSPLAGTEGNKVTGRMIRDRLLREAEGNVALRVRESDDKDAMEVAGRGELQLGILIETMRREGFELSVSRPKVLLRQQRRRRTGRADRRGRDRRRREAFRRRRAEDVRAQGRDDRDAAVRRRPRAPGVLRADARPDRLSGRTADRHARHRHHEPAVPRLCAAQGRDPGPPQRRADLQRTGRGRRLRDVEAGRPRPDDDRAGLEGLSRHDRRRAHPRQRPRDQRAQGQAAHQHPHHAARTRRCA